jgi:hypothetical protein
MCFELLAGMMRIPMWEGFVARRGPFVGGGEKGYQNGGEVVPYQESRSE